MATLRAVFASMEATVELQPRWRGGDLDRLLDERHASIVTGAAAYLVGWGWLTTPEVTYSVYGERGSIDLLAVRESASAAVMLEIKTSINSAEELLRKTDAKMRLLPGIVAERYGWRPASVARILVVADDRTNRRRVRAIHTLLADTFPGSTVDTKRWLRSPVPDLPGPDRPGRGTGPGRHDRPGRGKGSVRPGRGKGPVRPGIWFLPDSHPRDIGQGGGGRDRIRVLSDGMDRDAQPPRRSLTKNQTTK